MNPTVSLFNNPPVHLFPQCVTFRVYVLVLVCWYENIKMLKTFSFTSYMNKCKYIDYCSSSLEETFVCYSGWQSRNLAYGYKGNELWGMRLVISQVIKSSAKATSECWQDSVCYAHVRWKSMRAVMTSCLTAMWHFLSSPINFSYPERLTLNFSHCFIHRGGSYHCKGC